jgi:hypothetical protein
MVGVAAEVQRRRSALRIEVIEWVAETIGLFWTESNGSTDLGTADEAGFDEGEDDGEWR